MVTALEQRAILLQRLKRYLPSSPAFEQWLAESGELPPDFDRLPSVYEPQDLLVFADGRRVTRETWPARRRELLALTEDWLLGHAPAPQAAGDVRAVIVRKRATRLGERWDFQLEFGPNHQAKLPGVLIIPRSVRGRAPVFITDRSVYRLWVREPMKRGFVYCYYMAGDDSPDIGPNPGDHSRKWETLFGEHDWSAFRRRAWAMSRVVDWLVTLAFVDPRRIYTGGHSRSGKRSLVAAAFDERIAGVIASSPGAGGSIPYRYCDGSYFGESIEIMTRVFPDWVAHRTRFFSGREHKLPADNHFLYALIAPRPVLMSTGIYDPVESTWAIERTYELAAPVYQLLGAAGNLALRYRPTRHEWIRETCDAYGEFLLDLGAGNCPVDRWPYRPFHTAPPPQARETASAPLSMSQRRAPMPFPPKRQEVLARLDWLFGEGPAYEDKTLEWGVGDSDEEERLHVRNWPASPQRLRCRFGDGVHGQLYFPSITAHGDPSLRGKLPGVVFLAPFACANGYTGTYRSGDFAHTRISAKGNTVLLAFDPLGTGTRQFERQSFYTRHPHWSVMGQMVRDARQAVAALRQVPEVDLRKVYLVGYGLGGLVATLTAAVEERIAGAISIGGWAPLRQGPQGREALRLWSVETGWLPRLAPYLDQQADVPVDFDEILTAIAPRRMMVVTPQLDWHANLDDVKAAVLRAQCAWGTANTAQGLDRYTPEDFHRLSTPVIDYCVWWISRCV